MLVLHTRCKAMYFLQLQISLKTIQKKKGIFNMITKKNIAINATKQLRAIRAKIDELKKQENELKEVVKEYLLENGVESLNTAECTAILRHTPKFKVFDKQEALNLAVEMKIKEALKLDETGFGNVLKSHGLEKSVWGTDTEDIALRITYKKG